jgi:siroheme decarboxylase
MLDELDKKIIAALQGDLPLIPEPYRQLAQELEIAEDELLSRLQRYRRCGHLRKMGLVLRHQEVGYKANALCAWVVPGQRVDEVGRQMATCPSVSHCYARTAQPGWPYNFYIMLHASTREECRKIAAYLGENTRLDNYVMLFSIREWKKTSMHYFQEAKQPLTSHHFRQY